MTIPSGVMPIESPDERDNFRKANTAFREASIKFTYYVAGLSLAILMFSLQDLPKAPHLFIRWCFLVSWGMRLPT